MNPETNVAEVIIIGGGPAGLSAAMWCRELGLKAAMIEREAHIGGQLLNIYNPIENYLGLRAKDGRDLLARFDDATECSSLERKMRAEVIRIDPSAGCVVLGDGTKLSWKFLVIATGVRRRRLGIPGESEYRGKGILESGVRDKQLVKGKRVLIIGGGDAAIENALLLSEVADSVKVAFRRSELTARPQFRNAIDKKKTISLLPQTVVKRIAGEAFVSDVEFEKVSDGRTWGEPVDAVLVRIGVEPNSDLVREFVELDSDGYIRVDATGVTSCPNVYAVGDVANPTAPTISTAAGTGATAAKNIYCSLLHQRDIMHPNKKS